METGIHVGNKNLEHLKESLNDASEAIGYIFQMAHENHMEQDTVQKALATLSAVAAVHNVTITNSQIVSRDKHFYEGDNGVDES